MLPSNFDHSHSKPIHQGWRGISTGLVWAAEQVQEHKPAFPAAKLRLKIQLTY